MKLIKYVALAALVIVIVTTSINCVQQGTVTPAASPSPSPSPTPEPLPVSSFTADEQIRIYGIADPGSNEYVKDRIMQTVWRTQHEEDGRLVVNTSYKTGGIVYMRFHEVTPDADRVRVLPAAIYVPGNPEAAGINVIAFVNTSQGRVEYIGFVPREGTPLDNTTITSTAYGLEERDPVWGLHQYNNVTIVDTGFVPGMSLTQAQKDQVATLAMTNATVQGYIGGRNAEMRNVTVHSFESGHPYRYVLAYPLITIDVVDGTTRYDTIFVLADLKNNRIAGIQHGSSYLW